MSSALPDLLHVTTASDSVNLLLHVRDDLSCFDGHFPGFSLLPGALQLDWAVRYARQYIDFPPRFVGMESIKFQAPILPDEQIGLELSFDAGHNRLTFAYTRGNQRCSSGHLVFAA